jgi:hypothetical protein
MASMAIISNAVAGVEYKMAARCAFGLRVVTIQTGQAAGIHKADATSSFLVALPRYSSLTFLCRAIAYTFTHKFPIFEAIHCADRLHAKPGPE